MYPCLHLAPGSKIYAHQMIPFHQYCTTRSSLVWRVAYFYQLYLVFVLRSLTYFESLGISSITYVYTQDICTRFPIKQRTELKTLTWIKRSVCLFDYLVFDLCLFFFIGTFSSSSLKEKCWIQTQQILYISF